MKKAKGQTTHYVFQGTEPIFEKQVTTGKTKSYVYALSKYLARVDGVIGDPKAKKYFYHTDHVGSIRAITDQAGKVVYKADYLTFGTQFSKEGDFEELHGFTGKEYDPDIGLYYFNARWYDPDLGRFISEDSARDPNNPNLYSYCGNNPVMRVDPTGKFWTIVIGAILGGLDAHLSGGDFMQGFVMGAITGAMGAGVNTFVSSVWGSALGTLGSQMVSGAIAGGITGEFFGEGFGKGAVFGAVSGAISYGVDMRYGQYASRGTYNRLVVSGLKGGLNGLARGGDFVEGFAYGFNEGVKDNALLNSRIRVYAKKTGGIDRVFDNPDDAALDFAMRYNDDSIRLNREYGAYIYEVNDSNGNIKYSYTLPEKGVEHMVQAPPIPKGLKIIAFIHTHSGYDENGRFNISFSRDDEYNTEDLGIDGYLATPVGSLEKWSFRTGLYSTISSSIPSDPKAGIDRLNNVNPYENTKNDPCHDSIWNYLLYKWIQPTQEEI